MNPKVSVIIPVYNVEKYLQNCIDSLMRQTLEEIEFIFVNDASPDNSLKILEYNQKKFPNKIRVIDSKINLKQGGARNLGIQAAKAPYIGFVDSDDFVSKEMYERLYDKIKEIEADAVFAQCAAVSDNMDIKLLNDKELVPFYGWKEKLLRWNGKNLTDQGRMDLMCYPIGGVWSGLWKKSVIEDNSIWFPEKLRYEDNYWGVMMDCYMQKVGFVEEIHYYYRQNPVSTIHGKNQSYHYDRIIIEKMMLDEMKNRDLHGRYRNALEFIYIRRYAMNTFNILIEKFDKPQKNELKEIKKQLKTEFPGWKRNKYFKELSKKEIIRTKLIMIIPVGLTIKILKYKWS